MLSKLAFPLLLGAGGLLLLTGKSSASAPSPGAKPASPSKPSSPGVPQVSPKLPAPEDLRAINAALASADPAKMRAVAAELEARGFTAQAQDLRAAADNVEAAIKQAPALPMPPAVTSPGAPTTGAAPKDDPAREFAGRFALMIHLSGKGREDKNMTKEFQKIELARKQYTGAIDGLYGPKSALALAHDFGIVPPKPFYWPTNPTPAKNAYRTELLSIAQRDPPRAEEWRKAAAV